MEALENCLIIRSNLPFEQKLFASEYFRLIIEQTG
jgi:hypothetical protein